jgi:hypothetical protein
LGYVRAGKNLDCDIRVSEFGYIDKTIRKLIPIAPKNWQPDLLIIVYESYPFLSEETIEEICKFIPRANRILIDPDCKYSEPCSFGKDSNHPTSDSYSFWTSLYDSLSDIILQPFIGKRKKTKTKIHSFLYFGMDNKLPNFSRVKKDFDLLYVGNNWYRWQDIKKLITKVSSIRSLVKRIGIFGKYWNQEVMSGDEEATVSDFNFLKQNKIIVRKSVPYGQVEKFMSRGLLNPIFIRPILHKLQLITPRMLETFNADTIPLIPSYFSYAKDLYGEEIHQLMLGNNWADAIVRIINNYGYYRNLSKEIKKILRSKHSYEARIKELLEFV